jgi:hypothetical protein
VRAARIPRDPANRPNSRVQSSSIDPLSVDFD